MELPVTYDQALWWLKMLALAQTRILALFIALPLRLPAMLRFAAAAALGLVAVPVVADAASADAASAYAATAAAALAPAKLLLILLKEAFIGFAMGYLAAMPFWLFEAVGILVDHQRGAGLAATLDPLSGNDASPLGLLFHQAFIVFFLLGGGFSLLLGTLYDSFTLWGVLQWTPELRPESVPRMLEQLDRLVRLALLLAAPALVAMWLAEFGLALVGRFAPQLPVFFMAMPVKSALALLVLVLYAASLFEHAADQALSPGRILPWLRGQWEPGG